VPGGGCSIFLKLKKSIIINDLSRIGSILNRDLMTIYTSNHG
jgi:hypothetical protein